MAKVGFPPIYDPDEHPRTYRKLVAEGKTGREIAELFGVHEHTISDWKREHVEFGTAFKLGKEDQADAVERAAFQRATGYSWQAEKPIVVNGQVEVVKYQEHVPPDPSILKYYLNNRRAKEWQEKVHTEHSGQVGLLDLLAPKPSEPQQAQQ